MGAAGSKKRPSPPGDPEVSAVHEDLGLPCPPAPDVTWGPDELEINQAAHTLTERLRVAREAGADLSRRVREVARSDGLGPTRIAEVTGFDEDLIREMLLDSRDV
jgi:hypothetical protein